MNDIGERIYKRRKELKMTQRDLAEMIDVSDKTVSRWENGSTIPDATQIPLIAGALQIEPNDLFEKDETGKFLVRIDDKKSKDYGKTFMVSVFASSGLALVSAIMFSLIILLNAKLDGEGTGFLIVGIVCAVASLCVYFASEILFVRSYSGKFRKEAEERTDFLLSIVYFAAVFFLPAAVLAISTFHGLSDEMPNAVVCMGLYLLFVATSFVFFKIKHRQLNRRKLPIIAFLSSIGIFVTFLVLAFLGHPIFARASIVAMAFDIVLVAAASIISIKA